MENKAGVIGFHASPPDVNSKTIFSTHMQLRKKMLPVKNASLVPNYIIFKMAAIQDHEGQSPSKQ